ncbi:MAG: SOS response-associated peptidase [Dehalobacter sp. 4CP]|uniref:SOS response-associated peptidase n=1 Tax=Dehalobacter sp. CP TaxID=2594474 RepID=UPI0013C78A55|nr:SOS response-associated peptidase [Dehalobacter sp. 4CP]
MCGRFILTLTFEEVAEILNIKDEIDWKPRYNIAPVQQVPVVVNDGANHLKLFQWGLVPSWSKDSSIGNKMINARAETVDTKPSFRHSFQRQRCMILTDGFYEWKREEKKKTPYRFMLADRTLFGFAGIWDSWMNPEGKTISSCAIITTEANELMAPIHNRMPVILDKEKEEVWLDASLSDSIVLKSLLVSYDAKKMNFYEVSSKVNSTKYDSIECIQPADKQASIF